MKKTLIYSVLSGVAVVGLSTGVAGAWHYGITGTGACQTDGSYKITWTVDNTSEPTALEIHSSSDVKVVPANTSVPAGKKSVFVQTADGTKVATYTLTLKGDWNGDRSNQAQTGTVRLTKACDQPKPIDPVTPVKPVEGGKGGEVLGTSTTQVTVAPVGAVSAGQAGNSINMFAALGLVGSVAVTIFGALRFVKRSN